MHEKEQDKVAGQLNCKHSPVSMLEFYELWWTFWLGGDLQWEC